jgi:phage baseplate assembly protein W
MVLYGKVATKITKESIVSGPKAKRIGLQWPSKQEIAEPFFDKSSGYSLIKDQIRQFILTSKGERVMMPDFGTSLMNFVFEPFTSSLASLLANEIIEGMVKYIPNVRVSRVRFFQDDNIHGFGLPGIRVQVAVSPVKSSDIINIQVTI